MLAYAMLTPPSQPSPCLGKEYVQIRYSEHSEESCCLLNSSGFFVALRMTVNFCKASLKLPTNSYCSQKGVLSCALPPN